MSHSIKFISNQKAFAAHGRTRTHGFFQIENDGEVVVLWNNCPGAVKTGIGHKEENISRTTAEVMGFSDDDINYVFGFAK